MMKKLLLTLALSLVSTHALAQSSIVAPAISSSELDRPVVLEIIVQKGGNNIINVQAATKSPSRYSDTRLREYVRSTGRVEGHDWKPEIASYTIGTELILTPMQSESDQTNAYLHLKHSALVDTHSFTGPNGVVVEVPEVEMFEVEKSFSIADDSVIKFTAGDFTITIKGSKSM